MSTVYLHVSYYVLSQKCNRTHEVKNFTFIFTSEELQEQKLFSTKSSVIYTH